MWIAPYVHYRESGSGLGGFASSLGPPKAIIAHTLNYKGMDCILRAVRDPDIARRTELKEDIALPEVQAAIAKLKPGKIMRPNSIPGAANSASSARPACIFVQTAPELRGRLQHARITEGRLIALKAALPPVFMGHLHSLDSPCVPPKRVLIILHSEIAGATQPNGRVNGTHFTARIDYSHRQENNVHEDSRRKETN
ncbi:hypothetical protein NDU88_003674 [Pleurodeles waltl]|uniref:Uncharacterized protein n=1 Tax=Pleurodeles waltl TaxID=8319 RepID=A0AAV7KZ63_PLEWA|nr:hypothetical protein NDU88_003674 [Pleurodeles waltl]